MYITIERTSRGNLEISKNVIDNLVASVVATNLEQEAKNIEILSNISFDDMLFLIVKITLNEPGEKITINERKIIREVEKAIQQSLDFKPRNIAIAYYK